jgi:branched-chain amino acid transport system permease protein
MREPRRFRRRLGTLAVLAVLIAVIPYVVNEYYVSILVLAALYGIMAIGLNLLMGYTGQISFGHNAFVGLGAYSSAILTTQLKQSGWMAGLIGLLLTAVVALAIGLPTLRLRGHYLAMGTAAWGVIGFVLFSEMDQVTRGFQGIAGIPPLAIGRFAFDSAERLFYLAWTILVLLLIGSRRLIDSRVGRVLRAIRSDEQAAATLGIRTIRYRVQIFVVSALCAACAGSLLAHWLTYVSPEQFSPSLAIQLLVIVLAGGLGTLWGPVVGSVALTALAQVTSGYQGYSQLIFGGLLVVMLIFAPRGLVGQLRALRERWGARRSPVGAQPAGAAER